MTINVTIDNTEYPGVSQIDVGGKTLLLTADALSSGVPDWLSECHVQEYTPEADTNEDVTFDINLSDVPQLVLVLSDMDNDSVIGTSSRTMMAMVAAHVAYDETLANPHSYAGAWKYYTSSVGNGGITSNATTDTGVSGPVNVSGSSMTIRSYNIGGTRAYWRAGHTYRIIAARV